MLSHIIVTMKMWASQGFPDKILQCVDLARYTTSGLTWEHAKTSKKKQDSHFLPSTPAAARPSPPCTADPINKNIIAPIGPSQVLKPQMQISSIALTNASKSTKEIVVRLPTPSVPESNARRVVSKKTRVTKANGTTVVVYSIHYKPMASHASVIDDDGVNIGETNTPLEKAQKPLPSYKFGSGPVNKFDFSTVFKFDFRAMPHNDNLNWEQDSATTPICIDYGGLPIFQTAVS
jgi:hypothetical protein